MDLFVIICKDNVKCFVLLNGLLVLSRVMLTPPWMPLWEAVGEGFPACRITGSVLIPHPTRCEPAILEFILMFVSRSEKNMVR